MQATIESYFKNFPPKSMGVSVTNLDTPVDDRIMRKKILVASKDYKAGETIYKEHPIVSTLDFDLQAKGTHCTHCLRHIQTGMAIKPDGDRLGAVYCSKHCELRSMAQSQGLLFTLTSPFPEDVVPKLDPDAQQARDSTQIKYAAWLTESGRAAPILAARFTATSIAQALSKISSTPLPLSSTDAWPVADEGIYSPSDHIERLRFLELPTSQEELDLLINVLSTMLPELTSFATQESQAVLLGKMAYNCYGVCYGGGRNDKPASQERPEDVEKTRTPYGTDKQIGTALFLVSSYINHSCSPSARPSFASGTSELHLIANHDINKGDEITVAYVDVTRHADETVEEARRRRRAELVRGWRFPCMCPRCVNEAPTAKVTTEGNSADLEDTVDESKVEERVERLG